MRRTTALSVLLIVVLASNAPAQEKPTTTTPAGAPTTAPSVVKVRRGELSFVVTTTGAFEAVDPLEVRVRTKAYQGELTVVSAAAPGAQVAKDDVILELDQTSLKRQLATAENELTAARANHEKARADVELGEAADQLALRMQQDDLRNAEAGLKWWEDVDGKQMLQNADLGLQNAKDNVGDQEDELDQLKKMYKSEELTNATADIVVKRAVRMLARLKTMADMTAARTQKVKENDYEVQHVKVQNGVELQKQALERLKVQQAHGKVIRETSLNGAKLALDGAEEKLANLKADADQFVVKSPQTLTVVSGQYGSGSWQNANPRGLRAGDKVAANQVVMTAYAPARLRFVADVPEAKVLLVTSGSKVSVTPNALPQVTMDGTAGAPSPTANQTGNYPTPIELNGTIDPRLEPGMKASVSIDSGKAENVLIVPIAAVKGRKVTLKAKDGVEKVVEVTAGRSDEENLEITSGLNDGDEIISPAAKK